jgi:UDP-N-acetylglucosamine--N-acetylmuramyl-(pentapeptide) pyrophosphoryl-undecaprenol N-acetylglucosamine transferase
MKIILAGGSTAGSVMPLLAVYSEIKKQRPDTEFLFVGTRNGEPEKKLLRGYGIPFKPIYGGKLRRYIDIRNISDLVLILIGFFQSLVFINRLKVDIIIGAGGFISVPVIWAGWVLRKKILIHQQDIKPSLSNILCLNLANRITVTFEKSLRNFPAGKTIWTGNPVREDILKGDKEKAITTFKLKSNVPIVLIVGGSTGALGLNTIVNQALPDLVKFCQIFHLTGAGKKVTGIQSDRYQQHEFLNDEMNDVLMAADLIISRAGLAAVTEFCTLSKPVILVPLPNSHQENNASYFAEKGAAMVIQQQNLSPSILADKIKKLIGDKHALSMLTENIKKMMKPGANRLITDKIFKLAEE